MLKKRESNKEHPFEVKIIPTGRGKKKSSHFLETDLLVGTVYQMAIPPDTGDWGTQRAWRASSEEGSSKRRDK